MKRKDLGAFLGVETAINPRYGNPLRSQDELNCVHENGTIKPRYGYRNLDTATTNFATAHGLFYIQGYNSSNALVEEYISAERLSTDTASKFRLYARSVTAGTETEITNGGSGVEITFAGTPSSSIPYADLIAVPWQSDAYIVCPANAIPLYKHTIGTSNSLTPVQVPADPTTALTKTIVYTGSGGTAYNTLNWAGTAPATEVTYTAPAQSTNSVLNSDNTLTIGHTTSLGNAAFEVDLSAITANTQDWTYNDAFAFQLFEGTGPGTPFHISESSIKVTFTNADGSPITFNPITVAVRINPTTINVFVYTGDKTRASWDNIKYFKVAYSVTSRSTTAAQNLLKISHVFIGGCFPAQGYSGERLPGGNVMRFGYSYYFSTPQWESGVAGTVDIPIGQLSGYNPLAGGTGGNGLGNDEEGDPVNPDGNLGCYVLFGIAASADSNVDNARLYWFAPNGNWKRIVTQDDATATYYLKMSYAELLALTDYSAITPFKGTDLVGCFPFKSSMVWLYKGGYQNVRFSRIASPLNQSSTLDDINDVSRGATFSLADNFGDQPLGTGFQCDDAAMIPGLDGIYASVGDQPYTMTPPKRLPGSYGVPNVFACCKATFNGVPGVCAVSKNGSGCFFYAVSSAFDGETGFKVEELTERVRPSIMDFLVTPQVTGSYADVPTALANIRVVFDESEDSLWIILGTRAMKLGRPSLETQEREWEFYRYTVANSGLLSWVSASTRRRIKWLRSTGLIDENYFNSSTNAYIEGSTRDGGSAMPTPYWTTKIDAGQRRRFMWAHVRKTTGTNTPTLTVITDENTFGPYTVSSGKEFVKGFGNAVGREIAYKLTLAEGDAAYLRMEIYESEPIGDRRFA